MNDKRWALSIFAVWVGGAGWSMNLEATAWQVLLGPPSLGQGGSNPLGIPPLHPIDWQVVLVTAEQREWVLSLVPGLLYGFRFQAKGFYAALGGGILITSSGLGLGVDHAYGYQTKPWFKNLHGLAEYRQVVGLGNAYSWQFPYSFRLGISYDM